MGVRMTYICPTCGKIYETRLCPHVCDCGEWGFNFKKELPPDICEWCGMTYPAGGWNYYSAIVFRTEHVICSDCYEQLKLVKNDEKNS